MEVPQYVQGYAYVYPTDQGVAACLEEFGDRRVGVEWWVDEQPWQGVEDRVQLEEEFVCVSAPSLAVSRRPTFVHLLWSPPAAWHAAADAAYASGPAAHALDVALAVPPVARALNGTGHAVGHGHVGSPDVWKCLGQTLPSEEEVDELVGRESEEDWLGVSLLGGAGRAEPERQRHFEGSTERRAARVQTQREEGVGLLEPRRVLVVRLERRAEAGDVDREVFV